MNVVLSATLHSPLLKKKLFPPITAGLLPVERVGLPDAAPLHGPLEDAGDHGVVGLVRVLQHLWRLAGWRSTQLIH